MNGELELPRMSPRLLFSITTVITEPAHCGAGSAVVFVSAAHSRVVLPLLFPLQPAAPPTAARRDTRMYCIDRPPCGVTTMLASENYCGRVTAMCCGGRGERIPERRQNVGHGYERSNHQRGPQPAESAMSRRGATSSTENRVRCGIADAVVRNVQVTSNAGGAFRQPAGRAK